MPANSEKEHLSIVICGHVDSGKSTTTGRLLFELGGIPERELEKLKAEAERLGKASFAFAFYMDRQKEERERGVTIACTTKEFFTEKWHYTIIDAPGHRDFIKNMITGASQADVALIMVPSDGNFTTAIARGNHKAGEIQGQTRQHARLINLLGVKQIVIGINKMDCDTAGYKKDRYDEIQAEMSSMLVKVGWKKDFVEKNTPFLPISGWMGDNLLKKSDKMAWWKGADILVGSEKLHVDTLYDCLDKMCRVPDRPISAPMRMPISGIYKIKGVGDVLAGRVEQGVVKPGEEVLFMPTHTSSNPCSGKVFTVEMHHTRHELANPGDNVGLNIKGLDKNNMPRSAEAQVKSMTSLIKSYVKHGVKKIGEGTYGEAYRGGDGVVMKIVPMGGDALVNGEVQMGPNEIRSETAILKCLTTLREGERDDATKNFTDGFIRLIDASVCRGPYSEKLLQAWDKYAKTGESENEKPDYLPSEQLYIAFACNDGGTDLEHFDIRSMKEAVAMLFQIVVALSVAEEATQFEHRDLHWGNVLIKRVRSKEKRARLNGVDLNIQTAGLDVTIIDFTLSRLTTENGDAFCDLNADPELFTGPKGHCQSETYRRMKRVTKGKWNKHNPKTNALWLHYLADTVLEQKDFNITIEEKQRLIGFRKRALDYKSAREAMFDEFFTGIWTSGKKN